MFLDFYQKHFLIEEARDEPLLTKQGFPSLMEDNLRTLDMPISQEEIKKALFEMAHIKPLARMACIQHCTNTHGTRTVWHFVLLLLNFFHSGLLPQDSNDTFITLIPKTSLIRRPSHSSDPCNVKYQVIMKLLTNRLKDNHG